MHATMSSGEGPAAVSFSRAELLEQVEAFAQRFPAAAADRRGIVFADGPARLRPPLTALRARSHEPVVAYLRRLAAVGEVGGEIVAERLVVLLLRAGAAAIGCWDGDELVDHKALRTYVVRGSGKAQPTWLETRGKSRYGSRLRLQNWQRLLASVNVRLASCRERFGEPERIFLGVPVRVLADLFAAEPPPPFAPGDARIVRLPIHVHRPDHAELLRVREWMDHGRLELPPT